jgi:hypothetical protein
VLSPGTRKKNGRNEEARGSQAASDCSLELARLVNDQSLAALAQEALLAISQRPQSTVAEEQVTSTENHTLAYWHKFFERWGYSQQYLEGVKAPLASIAERR